MIDREKTIEAFTRCGSPGACSDKCAYFSEGFNCYRAMRHDILELLKEQPKQPEWQPEWHPYDPLEPDDEGLEDHNFYLVTTKDRGTPMKAMCHLDKANKLQPCDGYFDVYSIVAWCELPEVMKHD